MSFCRCRRCRRLRPITEFPVDWIETISNRMFGKKIVDDWFLRAVTSSAEPGVKTMLRLIALIWPVASTSVRREIVIASTLLGKVTKLPMRPGVIERIR